MNGTQALAGTFRPHSAIYNSDLRHLASDAQRELGPRHDAPFDKEPRKTGRASIKPKQLGGCRLFFVVGAILSVGCPPVFRNRPDAAEVKRTVAVSSDSLISSTLKQCCATWFGNPAAGPLGAEPSLKSSGPGKGRSFSGLWNARSESAPGW
ncbi:hypothetical protein N657DRAFT_93328 [Parathielavia appendiculata]|uniref:Uncharacterized protein n=1 Tax=Parathielavia appendiculata TaxID=2587402 RepID=A0AAN6UB58_9PEZI|nr:hypothetical protein N657DRAFT_93328 [Parathielavia appendiculata]